MTTYIISRTSDWTQGQSPYVNAHRAKASFRVGQAGIEWSDVWVTDDDPFTVFDKTGEDVIIHHSNYREYPVALEIYDDYRE
ncbi:hypothetical protein [Bifidobacterium myosotis]|uniref:Uncharacterized protein n=1 Tax=Bifidobacterium myosotis TaxID=1630166 RepID=A0A5M9ZI15_9BIFI|nr:hypothetical protein [Bifidobacterium myosotis]KAA8827226.1 hypothetical protein EMO91_09250 [Bifidobacterium myosotis]